MNLPNSIDDRNDAIRVLWNDGLTLQAIADKFGLSRERVRQILRSHKKIGGVVATKAERRSQKKTRELDIAHKLDDEIVSRLSTGESLSAISIALGIRPRLLSQVVRELVRTGRTSGPRYMPTDQTKEVWRLIETYRRQHKTLDEIGNLLNLSRSAIVRHVRLMRANGVIEGKISGPLPDVMLDIRREKIIREMLAKGHKFREIAKSLGISVHTLNYILARIRSYK